MGGRCSSIVSRVVRSTRSLDCHDERGDGEFGTHVLAHGPANHLAGEQVEDHGQVKPALAGRNVGDIRQPDLIGPVRDKILLEQVCRHRQAMLAVGCAHAIAARRPRPDTVLAHDPFDPLAADGLALGAQFGVDARRSVSFPMLRMDPPDVDQQRAIGDLAWAVRPRPPRVVARRRHAQRLAPARYPGGPRARHVALSANPGNALRTRVKAEEVRIKDI